MLKKRIIPVQLLHEGRLVKPVKFAEWRDVGDPVKSSAVYNSTLADELIFLNIARDNRSIEALGTIIKKVSEVIFMPLAMGGGIASAADASFLILNGADKIVLNTRAYTNPEIITETAERFGAQSVVVSIDVRRDDATGDYELYSDCGRQLRRISLEEHIDNVDDHTASLLQVAKASERDEIANAPHKEISISSISALSPSKIPSPSQFLSSPSKSANARPTKIPTYTTSYLHPNVRIAASSPVESPKPSTGRPLMADIDYSPEDDIIPTRQRWVNPRAHRPHLFADAPNRR